MLCSLESAKAWLPDLLETVEKCEVNGKDQRGNLRESFWLQIFLKAIETIIGWKWVFPKIGVPQNGWFISWKTL